MWHERLQGKKCSFRCIKIYCAFQQTSQSRVVLEWHLQKNDLLRRKKFLCICTLVRVSVHGRSQRVLEYTLLHAFVPEWVRVLAGMCVCSCMLVCKSANVWLCVCGWVNVSWGTGFNFLYSCARFKRLLFHEACTILPAHKVKSFECLLSFFSISAKAASLATKTFGVFSLGRWNFEKSLMWQKRVRWVIPSVFNRKWRKSKKLIDCIKQWWKSWICLKLTQGDRWKNHFCNSIFHYSCIQQRVFTENTIWNN